MIAVVATAALGLAARGDAPRNVVLAGYGVSAGQGSSASDASQAAPGRAGRARPRAATSSFSIAGDVDGLYPGRSLPLQLAVTNHLGSKIRLTSITTTVLAPSLHCTAVNLTVSAWSGDLSIPAGKTATVTVHASMRHAAPDACQGVVFVLRYHGLATAS